MPAPISVIIPTLNAAPTLSGTVAALFEGLEAGLIRELIISDGGSTDATLEMADEFGAVVVKGDAGRGGQLKRGAEIAQAQWLLFLHADTWLEKGWAECVQRHIQTQDTAACFRLRFRASGVGAAFVASWANLRTRLFGLPYGDQGLLISRRLFDEIGGFQDIPLMEDVAMARSLKGRLLLLDCVAETGAEKYLQGGWFKRGAQNFWTLAQYFGGVAPEKLAKRYGR
jgi:rSAM/selenodomain-associated transferase 2